MKKVLFLSFLVFAFIFSGCNKGKDEANDDPASGQGSVVFSGKVIDNGLKGLLDTDYIAEYALVTISGTVYNVDVYYIDDVPYTEAIKLDPGTYTVEQFLMYDDNETPGDMTDDVLIWATPETGSEFAEFILQPVPFDITVTAFMKHEIFIEVLRFIPDVWEEFGFIWFVVEESVIREQCFFGDICIKKLSDYVGSMYELQSQGLQLDMPAIAKIEVWQNTSKYPNQGFELMGTYDNEDWYGEGAPLCVRYKDYVLYEDMFEFRLFILVAVGEGFDYVHFLTWTFMDDEIILEGDDGIVDYVLGTCVPNADFIIPPYMNLPATATYTAVNIPPDNVLGGYIDATLSDIDPGYEIWNGDYASWCYDWDETIGLGIPYSMEVFSSLYPYLMPAPADEKEWDRANWLMNHLGWYDGYTWEDIQGALWLLDGWDGVTIPPGSGMNPATAMAYDMYDDAVLYGDGYLPPPGGWAAVVFLYTQPTDVVVVLQTVFIVIDP